MGDKDGQGKHDEPGAKGDGHVPNPDPSKWKKPGEGEADGKHADGK